MLSVKIIKYVAVLYTVQYIAGAEAGTAKMGRLGAVNNWNF